MPLSIALTEDFTVGGPNHVPAHEATNIALNRTAAAVDVLSAGVAPLARLRAMLTSRDFAPRVVVTCGDSNTAGVGASTVANEWVVRFGALLQREYPKASGSETAAIDLDEVVDPEALSNGVQIVNAGVSGASSGNYITSGTRPQIAALNPCLVTHILGFNSNASEINAATFKSEIQAQVTALKAELTEPCVHLLMVSFRTAADIYTDLWADIATGLAEIADDDPDGDVIAANLTPAYAASGVPGSDPLDLIDPDDIHMANAGHAMMASLVFDLVTRAPVVPSGGAAATLTNSSVPTITGTATQGQTLTAGNGTWSATPDSYTYAWKRGGSAISGATSSTYVLQLADVGSTITVTVTAIKSAHRSASATSAATGTVASSGGGSGPQVISKVGTLDYTADGGKTSRTVTPTTVGGILVMGFRIFDPAVSVSSITGGGCSGWARVSGLLQNSRSYELWFGRVDTAGSASATITYSGTIGATRVDTGVQEYDSAGGTSATWTADGAGGTLDASGSTIGFPTLTASAAHRLYVGYASLGGSCNTGDPCTSGYSVVADSNGNAWLTGLDVSGAQSPVVSVDGGAYSSVAGLIVATT